MKNADYASILRLMDELRADHPRRAAAADVVAKRAGIKGRFDLSIAPAVPVTTLATFSSKVFRQLTPMLKARFDYCSSWQDGLFSWLSAADMTKYMRKRVIHEQHRALRENWEGSAPMLFPDNELTLFGATKDVQDVVYLVWATNAGEPEVWSYEDYDFNRSINLEAYFKWMLERE